MNRNYLCFFTLLLSAAIPHNVYSQDNRPKIDYYINESNLGAGLGIDYGGIGFKYTFNPEKHLGLFAAAGYNFVGLGYNVGGQYRFNPGDKFCFYFTLMYGYNAAIKVINASRYDKIYYGPSTGAGLELHLYRRWSFFNFELLYMQRSREFNDTYNRISGNQQSTSLPVNIPLGISAGFHFRID